MEIDLPEAALKKLEVPMRLIGLAVVLALNLFLDPLSAVGQQPAKVYRIGFLGLTYDAYLASFRQELRDLGYVEGRNLILEIRRAEGKMELFPHYAAELVRLKVDLIVAGSGPATMAARAATLTIPIVMMGSADAVGHGLVASLAKPGGNVTGLTNMVPDLTQKRLQLLRELLPQLSHVGVLSCGRRGSSEGEAQAAAAFLRVQLSFFDVWARDEIGSAFASVVKQRAQAVLALECLHLARGPEMSAVAQLALQHRLPAMYPYPHFPKVGGLMSYSGIDVHFPQRAAVYVDKILKGAKPADLPVEQPTKFEFVINLKTAKALGLTIPRSVLGRADQVIE